MNDSRPVFDGRERIWFLLAIVVAGVIGFAVDWPWWAAGLLALGLFGVLTGADSWTSRRRSRR